MADESILGAINGDLDDKDWIIIRLIQSDARVSFAEIGRRTGLSPPAAAERLRRLEDAGVILGYHGKINPARLGLGMLAIIEMQVKRSDYQRYQKAIQKLAWILECHHVAGRASFYLKAAVPDPAGLELLIGLCLAKTKSAFEINNIKERDVTMLHAMWLGEITIRHRQVGSLPRVGLLEQLRVSRRFTY